MPIIQHKEVSSTSAYVVWEITEEFNELAGKLHSSDLSEIGDSLLENKKLEMAATRLAVANLVENVGMSYEGLQKDVFGKPHLPHCDLHISVSHSFPLAGAIIHSEEPTGIDIEKPRAQITRIRHKFLSDQELAYCGDSLDLLTRAWCAKEVLYKIHGRKQLSFKNQILLSFKSDQLIEGVITNGTNEIYELRSIFLKDHYLVFKL